jgi:hypothetical protein
MKVRSLGRGAACHGPNDWYCAIAAAWIVASASAICSMPSTCVACSRTACCEPVARMAAVTLSEQLFLGASRLASASVPGRSTV